MQLISCTRWTCRKSAAGSSKCRCCTAFVGGDAFGSARARFRDPLATGTNAPLTSAAAGLSNCKVSKTLATSSSSAVSSDEMTSSEMSACVPLVVSILVVFFLFAPSLEVEERQVLFGGGVIDSLTNLFARGFAKGFTRAVRSTHSAIWLILTHSATVSAVVVADSAMENEVRIGEKGSGIGTACLNQFNVGTTGLKNVAICCPAAASDGCISICLRS